MARPEFDLCVIGGGSAGLVVAAGGAALGAKVALIERRALGGDCLYYGCVPSKTLLHSAKVAHTMRRADQLGIEPCSPRIQIGQVMQRVASVISTLQPHDSPERFRGLGVEVIFGTGHFINGGTFQIHERTITASHFVLATGSRAAIPSLPGLDEVPYLTNETLFSLSQPVPSLMVLGAGPLGVEMAQAFSRLGSEVQVVERGDQILPREDLDLAQVVADQLRREGVKIHLGHQATRIERRGEEVQLWVREGDGQERVLSSTHLLIAAGRHPNVEGLGLDEAGVAVEKGRVLTDSYLRTTNPRIFAAGDVTSPYQFTHVAEHQAGVVLRNALFPFKVRREEKAIPWCTLTDPELARVGLSETRAKASGIAHQVYTFPFPEIDRAQTAAEAIGFAKVITSPGGRLLGAAIVGPHAGELIHEYVLALSRRMKLSDLYRPIHIYPTLAQISRRVAEVRLKQTLTPGLRKWIQRLLRLRGA
ncbi:MAG: FAD-dependent oxidoreductase [candidate division NC10 bacterium]|nr:FAD-dependent oxidoreductase [candidate division NC10 bacterium]